MQMTIEEALDVIIQDWLAWRLREYNSPLVKDDCHQREITSPLAPSRFDERTEVTEIVP